MIVVAGGKRQLIVWTGESVTSLNPTTGEPYWREAMVTSSNDSIPAPVVQNNRLLISGLMLDCVDSADLCESLHLRPQRRGTGVRLAGGEKVTEKRLSFVGDRRSL